ncbi:hypothetical protein NA78x_000351 [Anatilimnocola sp. NA78]|uniref:hypothetical protein n=1 Tax=Anatilimnocola sp. NA78 TaxID=3415683 RepID=UPI003CE5BAC3
MNNPDDDLASLEAELADLKPQFVKIANRLMAIHQRLSLIRSFKRWQQERPEDWTAANEYPTAEETQ